MREKASRVKEILCKVLVKAWIALSIACVGFLLFWLCLGAFVQWGLSRA
ncbi:MAG: hypothetical protein HFF58_04565 [Lawsonibacter sp.]|jgi:hypothetical protein|nr:hypothetical protein [Lawsonibacter sp.]